MQSSYTIVGQLGDVVKKPSGWLVNLAINEYGINEETGLSEKKNTMWFKCLSDFKPKAKVGDKVMVHGNFIPSRASNQPFNMKITHLGVVSSKVKDGFKQNDVTLKEEAGVV